MGRLITATENGGPITLSQWETFLNGLWRTPTDETLVSGVLTIAGTGWYRVAPESGVTDDLTGITLETENVQGVWAILSPGAAGQTIIVRHQSNLHLQNGQDAVLRTPYSMIGLRHWGSGVWAEWLPRTYVP